MSRRCAPSSPGFFLHQAPPGTTQDIFRRQLHARSFTDARAIVCIYVLARERKEIVERPPCVSLQIAAQVVHRSTQHVAPAEKLLFPFFLRCERTSKRKQYRSRHFHNGLCDWCDRMHSSGFDDRAFFPNCFLIQALSLSNLDSKTDWKFTEILLPY